MHWIFQKSENISKVQLATLSSLGFRTVYSVSSQELAFSAILLKVTLKNIQLQVWHHIHPEFFFPGNYLPCLHINWKLQVKMPFLQFLCPGTIFLSVTASLCLYTLTKFPQRAMAGPLPLPLPHCCQMSITSMGLYCASSYFIENLNGHIPVPSSSAPSVYFIHLLPFTVSQESPVQFVCTAPSPSSQDKAHQCSWSMNNHINHQFSKLTRTYYSSLACSS